MISTTGMPNQRMAAGCTALAIHWSSADTIGQASVAAGLTETDASEAVTGAPRAGPSGTICGAGMRSGSRGAASKRAGARGSPIVRRRS